MGSRIECLECDFVTWNHEITPKKQRHNYITNHQLVRWGDNKVVMI